MDHTVEFPTRKVEPMDLEEALAMAGDPESADAGDQAMVLLVDPVTRRPISGDWMPARQAKAIQATFDRITRRGMADAEAARAAGSGAAAVASRLIDLVGEASAVAVNLRALVYLFEKAVVDDGPDSLLTSAAHIVIDSARTIADRLDATEIRAQAVYRPLVDGRSLA